MNEPRDSMTDDVVGAIKALSADATVDLTDFPKALKVRTTLEGAKKMAVLAIEEAVGAETGLDDIEIRLDLAGSGKSSERRARFDSLDVTPTTPGYLEARAALTWGKHRFEGVANEEASPAGELRACANATIRSVEKFAEGQFSFVLIGVKEVRVFDHHLVAVLVQSGQDSKRRLMGTSLIEGDRRRSACLAVLNATNRAVGL